jgi:hypothetical protein
VIEQQPGWVRVLLPSKPNGSTGWVTDMALDRAYAPYLIRVHLRFLTVELSKGGQRPGKWTVGIGKQSAPTPSGRTYLLGSISDTAQRHTPVILGAHSPALDSFGGGPGTVAIHTPGPQPMSLVLVPAMAASECHETRSTKLTQVPLGTLVLLDEN